MFGSGDHFTKNGDRTPDPIEFVRKIFDISVKGMKPKPPTSRGLKSRWMRLSGIVMPEMFSSVSRKSVSRCLQTSARRWCDTNWMMYNAKNYIARRVRNLICIVQSNDWRAMSFFLVRAQMASREGCKYFAFWFITRVQSGISIVPRD